MTSSVVSPNGSQPPRLRVAPRRSKTFGDLAGYLSAEYGLTPDPWQQMVLDDWLGETRGRWSSLTCGLSCPRQNGKNGILEVRELFGMVGRGEKILHTAHQIKTAQKHFRRLKFFFGKKVDDPTAKFPELNALVGELRNVNGQEAIFLKNGGSVEIIARSQGSGRGFTNDVLVMDEAQDMSDDDLEGVMPATSSAPLGNPQWIFTGTPPGPKANGEVFSRVRLEALQPRSRRLAWHEWSSAGAVDLDDRNEWHKANPALGLRRADGTYGLQFDVIEGERARFSDSGFGRERLGMWDEASTRRVIDVASWSACVDEKSLPVDRLALAVDVSPDRSTASVSLAGQRKDGNWHIELDEQRLSSDQDKPHGWLATYITNRCERNTIRAVVIDGASPAAYLIDELRQRKIKVTTTGPRDMANACGVFYDGTMEGWLRHIDQPQLNASLGVARKRPLGDAWAWNRKNAAADITPLVSATLALWGAQSSTVNRPGRSGKGRRVVVLS